MEEIAKHGQLDKAAMKAGMDRKTGRKYRRKGKLPSELKRIRGWRTRTDPFAEHWSEVEADLATPGFEAKTLFEMLQNRHPGQYEEKHLRTFQRRVRRWRAKHGPGKDVVFRQAHRPGEAAQTDFTDATELAITIAGLSFVHKLCLTVLPYSDWQWATVCLSESMVALRRGVQRALFQLGRVPAFHQTDNSTAATHRIPDGKSVKFEGRKRPFNAEYVALMRHYGMTPRTTEIGAKEQNGDVEASNGATKRRLEQALLVRGNRDFESVEAWQEFIDQIQHKANAKRHPKVAEELAVMRELDVEKLPEFSEETVPVSARSTIRVKTCAYSVPSRLIGERVKVRIYEEKLEVYYAGTLELCCGRLKGQQKCRIDYRHVIWSLVRKPGAFARYVYREEMFPSLLFRRAYDAVKTPHREMDGDLEYLRILHLAASTMEADVEAALALLFEEGKTITYDAVKALVTMVSCIDVPALAPSVVDLGAYDVLLGEVQA